MPSFGGQFIFSSSSQAPGRRTFLEMKSELARPYNANDETALAIAGDAINAAIRRYNRRLWPWDILTDTLSFDADEDTQPISLTFKKPLAAHILDSSRKNKRLAYEPYESFVESYDLKQDGQPVIYTMKNVFRDGLLTVWPRPQSAYTIEVDYYARIPLMKQDDDPYEGPPESEEAVMAEADYIYLSRRPGTSGTMLQAKRADLETAWRELVAFAAVRGDAVGYP